LFELHGEKLEAQTIAQLPESQSRENQSLYSELFTAFLPQKAKHIF
jgi:hypothetical protein